MNNSVDTPASRAASAASAGIPVFDDLNIQQIRGEQCVVFSCPPLVGPEGETLRESLVVGVSKATGDEVRVCMVHARMFRMPVSTNWEQVPLL